MSYTPTTWADGDLITAQKLNNIENGLKNSSVIEGRPFGNDLNNYLTDGIYNIMDNQVVHNDPTPAASGKYILYVFNQGYYTLQIAIGDNGIAVRDYFDNQAAIQRWSDWKTYTVEQREVDQCFKIGKIGKSLSQNTDLNTCTTFGQYITTGTVTVPTLINCPVFDTNFILIVMPAETTSYAMQIIIPTTGDKIYMRKIQTSGSSPTQWREFGSTIVEHIITQQPQSNAQAQTQVGESTDITVKVTGDNLTYQWQYYNTNRGNWMDITSSLGWASNYNTDTLTVIKGTQTYRVRCNIIKNNTVIIRSREAYVIV